MEADMEITPIKTEADHAAALAEIEALMDAEFGTPDGDRLDVLATLVAAFESRHFPVAAPDPVDAIKFRMEKLGLGRKDLEPLIGGRGRVSEVLSGRRALSLAMIRRLHGRLRIPAEVLIQPPTPRPSR
jgi:HTH-type transcriptional regulator/antitoxin HigA